MRTLFGFAAGIIILSGTAGPARSQGPDSAFAEGRAKSGSQFWIPMASVFLPGLGQYVHGVPLAGAGFTATAVAGAVIGGTGSPDVIDRADLPRTATDQIALEGYHVAFTAGLLSAWDAFQRTVPALQAEGKYTFLERRDGLADLVTAPFDVSFLGRWTTWVHFAYTGLVTGLVMSERESGVAYEPYRARDVAFLGALSFNAGVGEEAAFRGWLFPMFHQMFGQRFWPGNIAQAGIFGALHAGQADEFALAITAWALYEGWLTQRNGWSIRESIFHHFWYDLVIGTATFLTDERRGSIGVTFPTIRF